MNLPFFKQPNSIVRGHSWLNEETQSTGQNRIKGFLYLTFFSFINMKFPYYKQLDSMDCGPSCRMAQSSGLRAKQNTGINNLNLISISYKHEIPIL